MKTAAQRIAICILAADYEAMRQLVGDDERLPRKHGDWAMRASVEVGLLTKRGESFVPVMVTPDELVSHCSTSGEQPSYALLEAMALRKAGG